MSGPRVETIREAELWAVIHHLEGKLDDILEMAESGLRDGDFENTLANIVVTAKHQKAGQDGQQ